MQNVLKYTEHISDSIDIFLQSNDFSVCQISQNEEEEEIISYLWWRREMDLQNMKLWRFDTNKQQYI